MNRWRAAATVAVLVLFAIGALRSDGLWFALAFPLAAWLLMSGGAGEVEPSLDITRELGAVFPMVDAPVAVTVRVRNLGEALEYVRLSDILPAGARIASGSPTWRGSLPAGSLATIRYAAAFGRGRHEFGGVAVSVEDAFAATRRDYGAACPGTVIVPPRTLRAPRIAAGPGAVRPYAGVSGARRPGDGAEFHGTRDYSPGDRLRNLNWRAGALWGESVVNVFEGDRAIDAGVILDCRAESYATAAAFEAAVAAALAVAEDFLDGGNRVAFMLYGSTLLWVPPGAGSAHRYRIRIAAASAELGDHAVFERFDHLPVNVFPPRSLIALVSPLQRDDLARLRGMIAQGYSVVALRPDPAGASAEAGTGRAAAMADRVVGLESDLLSARLSRAGASVLDWDISAPLSSCRPRGGAR